MKKKFIKIGNLKVEIPEDTQATITPETTENLNPESQVTDAAEPVVIGDEEKKEDDGERKSFALYYAAAGVSAVLFLFLAVALFLHHNQSGSQNENMAVKEATTTTKEPQKPVVVNHVKKTKKPVVVALARKKHKITQQPLIRKVPATTTTMTATTTTITFTTIKPETTTIPTTTITLPKAVVKPLPLRLGVQVTNSASPQGHVVNFQITTYDSKGVVPYQTIVIVNNSCQPSTVRGQTGIDGQFNATVACNNGSGIMATVSSGNQSETVNSSW